jgi:hypothetical protein
MMGYRKSTTFPVLFWQNWMRPSEPAATLRSEEKVHAEQKRTDCCHFGRGD